MFLQLPWVCELYCDYINDIYNKFLSYYDNDLESSFNKAFKEMLKNYNEIRLSIDLITIEKIIIYYFIMDLMEIL